MTTTAIHFGAICSECRRAIPPGEDKLLGNDHLRGHICLKCLRAKWDAEAELSRYLSEGGRTDGCAECGITPDAIWRRDGHGKMAMVFTAGKSVLFCLSCEHKFTQKHKRDDSLRGRNRHLSDGEYRAKEAEAERFRWRERQIRARMRAKAR